MTSPISQWGNMKTVILAPGMIFNCLKYMESLLHALLARSDAAFLHCWPCMTSFMTSLGSYELFVNNSRSNWASETVKSPLDTGRPAESNNMQHDLLWPISRPRGLWPDLDPRSTPQVDLTRTKSIPFDAPERGEHDDAKIAALRPFLRSHEKLNPGPWSLDLTSWDLKIGYQSLRLVTAHTLVFSATL